MVNRRVCVSCNLIWINILVFLICQEITPAKWNKKFFWLAPLRHREGDPLPPAPLMGAALNNHSELTRRGFRIRGGFAFVWWLCYDSMGQRWWVVSRLATLWLPNKIKIAENQMINSYLVCPEQDSNLHASRHAHLKRARLPFRHLGIAFWLCKVTIFFLSNKHRWNFFNDLFEKEQSERTNRVNRVRLSWEESDGLIGQRKPVSRAGLAWEVQPGK